MTFQRGITVTVERDPGTDEYGDPLEGYYGPLNFDIDDCGVAPRSGFVDSAEPESRGREGVIVGLTLFAPYGSDLLHSDRVLIFDGPHAGTYQVEGQPGHWRSPLTGREAGLQVALKRAVG